MFYVIVGSVMNVMYKILGFINDGVWMGCFYCEILKRVLVVGGYWNLYVFKII